MYKILHKEVLSDVTKLMVIAAPAVARKVRAGQFVIVRINERGERIPLTVADYDREEGTITIIFQEVGKTTMHLGTLEPGDELATFVGPLGHPTEIENYGTIACVGGGVGIAPLYPITRALKEAGIEGLSDFFIGPTSVVWSNQDSIMPARQLVEFLKKYKKGTIKAGLVDGIIIKDSEIETISKLPNKQELYAKLAASLNSPIGKLAMVLNAVPQKFVRIVDALRESKQ